MIWQMDLRFSHSASEDLSAMSGEPIRSKRLTFQGIRVESTGRIASSVVFCKAYFKSRCRNETRLGVAGRNRAFKGAGPLAAAGVRFQSRCGSGSRWMMAYRRLVNSIASS